MTKKISFLLGSVSMGIYLIVAGVDPVFVVVSCAFILGWQCADFLVECHTGGKHE